MINIKLNFPNGPVLEGFMRKVVIIEAQSVIGSFG